MAPSKPDLDRLIAVAATLQRRQAEQDAGISGQLPGHGVSAGSDWVVRIDGQNHAREVSPAVGGYRVALPAAESGLVVETAWQPGEALFRGTVEGVPVTVQVDRRGPAWCLSHGGAEVEALVLQPRIAALADLMPVKEPPDLSKFLLSPMPGLLVSVAVEPGQDIKAGEALAVVEAMKMENVLRAERDGVVSAVHAAAGDSLAVDQAILEFE